MLRILPVSKPAALPLPGDRFSPTSEHAASQHPWAQSGGERAVDVCGGLRVLGIEGIDLLKACWPHEGEAAALVRRLKYHRDTAAVTVIADALAAIAPDSSEVGLLTWVPCTPQRRRTRGFDPAELLARALARRLRRQAKPSLHRFDAEPQTARDKRGRLEGPSLVPRARRRRLSRRVLVVDDVCTTGSTLRVAAGALRSAGAGEIAAVVATAVRQRSQAESSS